MQSENYAQLLDRAARLWRIDPEYWDIWGRKHVTSDETKRAILKGLGVSADTAESLRAAIEARHRRVRPQAFELGHLDSRPTAATDQRIARRQHPMRDGVGRALGDRKLGETYMIPKGY